HPMVRAASIVILTHSPSPYQVELFNEIATREGIRLFVAYLFSNDASRNWSRSPLRHDAAMLDGRLQEIARAADAVRGADLVVLNYYNDPVARRLMRERAVSRRPWTFWGEKPGFRRGPRLGALARRWKLRHLHASPAPIWGIGRFAVEGYRSEFG